MKYCKNNLDGTVTVAVLPRIGYALASGHGQNGSLKIIARKHPQLLRTFAATLEDAEEGKYLMPMQEVKPSIGAGESLNLSPIYTYDSDTDEGIATYSVVAADLSAMKQKRFIDIDRVTGRLIGEGFTFGGEFFSLSTESQLNLLGLNQVRTDPAILYPVKWGNINDTVFIELANAADVKAFYLTALGTVRLHRDSGSALKASVLAAQTAEEILAVLDDRIPLEDII